MSRIEEGEADDNDSFLRACAFEANAKRALKGKKGQAVLMELLAGLEAMPSKRLISGVFADITIPPGDAPVYDRVQGDVCTMGCLLVHRKMTKRYRERGQALLEAVNEVTCHPDDGGSEAIRQAAGALDLVYPLAYELAYQNDEMGDYKETPEQRYDRILKWVKSKIAQPAQP